MPDLSDLPAPLARLAQKALDAVGDLTAQLANGEIAVEPWQREMERLLARYHVAAYMTGQDSEAISDAARRTIARDVQEQFSFLDAFAGAIIATVGTAVAVAGEFPAMYETRAGMYALAIKQSYWRGATSGLSLPAYPGDGSTQCLSNCGCSWDIVTIDSDNGDYDATWVRGKKDSCFTCLGRAADWSPLRIRGGRVI